MKTFLECVRLGALERIQKELNVDCATVAITPCVDGQNKPASPLLHKFLADASDGYTQKGDFIILN